MCCKDSGLLELMVNYHKVRNMLYLGLNDGLGAGLQHAAVVGENQELQLLCFQHHL